MSEDIIQAKETTIHEAPAPDVKPGADHVSDAEPMRERLAVERVAALFVRGDHGFASLPTAVSSSLRRLDVTRPARRIDAVIGTLVAAGIPAARMHDDEIARWSVVLHAVAVLSGTSGVRAHHTSRNTGRVIAESAYSSARFARLLTAQGQALPPQIARLTRFLAAARAVPLDLRTIAELTLWDGRDPSRADSARLTLARGYYASAPQAAASS